MHNMSAAGRIFPVLLAGGAGTRLWPLSQHGKPKHLLPLLGDTTLFQAAALRATDDTLFEPLTVIAGAEQAREIAGQLKGVGCSAERIVLEPVSRNTAAAAAVAGLLVSGADPEGVLLLTPADHLIADADSFRAAVKAAARAARNGALVLFGIRPSSPAPGYGYVRGGDPLPSDPAVQAVGEFVEKPGLSTAQRFLDSGDYLWNSGIFLVSAKALLSELAQYAPEVLDRAREAVAAAHREGEFITLQREAFERCPSISFDYAVLERTERAAVLAVDFSWSDVGSWSSLWDASERDPSGNAVVGDVISLGTTGSYLRSEGPVLATIGLEAMIVVATPEFVLVADRNDDQEVRRIVELLRDRATTPRN